MHDIRLIREHKAGFEAALLKRNDSFNGVADELLRLDEERRRLIASVQEMQERRNAASKEIGQAKAQKDEARAQGLMAEVSGLKERLPGAEAELKAIEAELNARLASLPNLPGEDVPEGADEHANVERHRHGQPRIYSFEARQHFDIGETLGQMDFETAARLSGSRFVVTKGPLARLERALGQFMLDTHVAEHGYLEVNPPLLVADHAMYGTAQLPKFEDDQFWAVAGGLLQEGEAGLVDRIRTSRLGLIPTAEVPLTNLVRELILDEKELPLRFAALTPCFRAEAGAAGRDTRGMIRQHQFSKVEMVSVTTPEASRDEHERMLSCAEAVLKKLDLAYRVVTLCTGDMGFSAQKTYDIEVWLPGQGAYREISSCSVCGDFQARRMNARYRPAEGKGTSFVHTLNGSGVAVGRALVAVLETYQNADGSVDVPEMLKPYMGGLTRVEKLG